MKNIESKTIVFVTGAFVSTKCWDNWKNYFESVGYRVFVPVFPAKSGNAEFLRKSHPNSEIANIRLKDLLHFYTDFIDNLDEKPIIIGHSLGGLLTQLLLQKGLGVAGVAIHSVPPQGVITFELSFYKSILPALGFFTDSNESYLMTFEHWQYTFTNGLSLAEQKRMYDDLVIPESKKAAQDGLTSIAKINFSLPHVPLLFVAGKQDHIMPASLNFSNYKKYKHQNSITDYKEFEHNNHNVLGLKNWQETAKYISDWIKK